MKTKAQKLIDQLDGLSMESGFNIGDVVKFTEGDTELIGVVEDTTKNGIYVRVFEETGEDMEPTDQVLVKSEPDLQMYIGEKSLIRHVTWLSEAGVAFGKLMGGSINVFDEGIDTGIKVAAENLVLTDTYFKTKNLTGRILAKMSDLSVEYDESFAYIKGYGSTYGNVDLGGDTISKGAYTQTLKHKNGKVKALFDHSYDMDGLAGVAYLEDSEKGLITTMKVPLISERIKERVKMIQFMHQEGEPIGMSIGYDAINWKSLGNGIRNLTEIALHEISITPFPMDTEAQIFEVQAKRISWKAKEYKWAMPQKQLDAPNGSQHEQGGSELLAMISEIKSLIKK